MPVCLKRAYAPPADQDGVRVLVDRLWPRGVSKAQARIDHWFRDIAPSTELRKWFAHDPEKWPAFQQRYLAELQGNPLLETLQAMAAASTLTLVFGARDERHNHAVLLRDLLDPRV